mgnify:CR=1 FL=1
MRRFVSKRKAIQQIERKMIETELDLHNLYSQTERAYNTGYLDGLGDALFMLSPTRARRNPLALVWYTEEDDYPTNIEIIREATFDAANSKLFQTVEAE